MRFFTINKYLIISKIALFISICTSYSAYSQVYSGEQNPLSVKWRQIYSGSFRIIYPIEMEVDAQRMANTFRHIAPAIGNSLNVKISPIPILLQNRGVIANGFVQLGPKKSEFFSTPPQNFDSQDWLNNLAVHELRHAAQFDKLTGSRPFPFPEQVYFAWMGASIPMWFFEGDAVTTETALTYSGRGRQPAWIMPYRTALLEGKKFSYSKANFGSEKDVTPGYYQLGYLLSSGIRKSAGKFVFDSVLTDIKKRPVRLYPFAGSLQKFTGKTGKQWYESVNSEIAKEWLQQDRKNLSENYTQFSPAAAYETNYMLPVQLEDGSILSLLQSKAETPAFVRMTPDGKQHRLKSIGQQEEPWFSYSAGKIVWDEIRYDVRFRQRSYSVVCIYDLETKKVKQLTTRTRIFSPTLSADGRKIAAVEIDLSNKINLIEMDAATGETIRTFPNPQNLQIQMPAYNDKGTLIAYITGSEAGKTLNTVDSSGKTTVLIPHTRQQLTRPVFVKSGIAFNAHYNGINNIYSIDPTSKKISALSASKYGAFNISAIPGTDSLIFNDYRSYGYAIAKMRYELKESGTNTFVYFGQAAEKQENTGSVFENIPDSTYTSSKYNALGNLFHVHSVIPVIEDEHKGGIQLVSNNLLNTVDSYAGIAYQSDLGRFEYNAGLSLKTFYPIFNLSLRNRARRTFYGTPSTGITQGDWRENYVKLEALVPFNFSSGHHNYGISVRAGTSYTQRYMAEQMPKNYITRIKFPLETGVSFSHIVRSSARDVAPRWAQILRLTYLGQPFDALLNGDVFAAEGFFYFPGLLRNHSFMANFNYQSASGIRSFNNEVNTVYGYNNIRAKSLMKNTLLMNYRFPLFFPDAELSSMAYIRSVRAGLFAHYENLGRESNLGQPKTYGFEIFSSMNLLRYQPIVDVGTRFIFVNKEYHQNPIFELIVNYTF